MKRLAIIGAGGHGKVVADAAEQLGWGSISFFDAVWPTRTENCIWPIQGTVETLFNQIDDFDGIAVAIGNNKTRLKLCLQILAADAPLVTLVHPTAYISHHATLGHGTVVFANAVINPAAHIGIGGIISTAATVDHDCNIGVAVHISPGAHLAGEVRIGDRTWIGIGAVVKHQIQIGSDVIVGAGSAVVKNIPNQQIVAGIPAKYLKDTETC